MQVFILLRLWNSIEDMFSQRTITYAAIFISLAVLNLLVDTHIARNLKRIALPRDAPLEDYCKSNSRLTQYIRG